LVTASVLLLHFGFVFMSFSSYPPFNLLILIPASTILGSGSEKNIQIVVFRVKSGRWLLMFRSNILSPSSGWKLTKAVCCSEMYPRTTLQHGHNMISHLRENLMCHIEHNFVIGLRTGYEIAVCALKSISLRRCRGLQISSSNYLFKLCNSLIVKKIKMISFQSSNGYLYILTVTFASIRAGYRSGNALDLHSGKYPGQVSDRTPSVLTFVVVFLSFYRQILEMVPWLNQDRFLPHPFQFINHPTVRRCVISILKTL
jgi:hypothetical protein